jgi:hypothetical protein
MVLFSQTSASEKAIMDSLMFFSKKFPSFVICFFKPPFLWCRTERKGVSVPLQRGFVSKEEATDWIRRILRRQIKERFSPSAEMNELFSKAFSGSHFVQQVKKPVLQAKLVPSFLPEKNLVQARSLKQNLF